MTLNGVIAFILRYFTIFGSFRGALCSLKVVEDVIVKKFTFAVSSPDEFLVSYSFSLHHQECSGCSTEQGRRTLNFRVNTFGKAVFSGSSGHFPPPDSIATLHRRTSLNSGKWMRKEASWAGLWPHVGVEQRVHIVKLSLHILLGYKSCLPRPFSSFVGISVSMENVKRYGWITWNFWKARDLVAEKSIWIVRLPRRINDVAWSSLPALPDGPGARPPNAFDASLA